MPRASRTWKHVELAIARLLNGRRRHFDGQDVECERYSVEVKHGRRLPGNVAEVVHQAQRNTRDRKKPLLVLHPLGAVSCDYWPHRRFLQLVAPPISDQDNA